MRHWLTRITDDEYDAALARTPEVCRPFAADMGDRRPALQCLAEYRADARRTRLPAKTWRIGAITNR